MKIKFLSYGYKHYEEQDLQAPKHDFLFNLKDLNNPYWVPELKELTGLDRQVIEFFEKDPASQDRLRKIINVSGDFIADFLNNKIRQPNDSLIFAFRCTGGRHRSVYFAEMVCKFVQTDFKDSLVEFEVEHIDLPRYITNRL